MFIKYFTVVLSISIHAAIGKVIVETFGSESIEDGPFGGNIDEAKTNLVRHAQHALGTGGNPFTDGGDIHLNGLISGMQIRSQSEIDAIQVFIPNLAY